MHRLCFLFFLILITACNDSVETIGWEVAGGNLMRQQHSTVDQITVDNVSDLNVAWVYRSGDARRGTQVQCNPIIVGNTVYATTAGLRLIALTAINGKEQWVFDPASRLGAQDFTPGMNVNRGVTYWTDGQEARVFYVAGSFLFSIDALTGAPDENFGDNGLLDLHDNIDRDIRDLFITATSPGVIYNDLLILGSRVAENGVAAPGHIRAFNVRTGAVEWIFHTIPHPGETGHETWEDSSAYLTAGGANAWSGFSLDAKRGLVFAGTGSATFDFYGGDRKGANLFANSILALDAGTGKYRWHFQTIHHDVWDRDLPAPPVLSSLVIDGSRRDVVIQATKTGLIFVLDRETGKPVFPVEEMEVPATSELIGEKLWPTQPMPTHNQPFMRMKFTAEDLNSLVPDSSRELLLQQFGHYSTGHIFTPPSENGTVFFPGLDGGAEWGGSSFDEKNGILYINSNEIPWVMTNVPLLKPEAISGESIYRTQCMSCHGPTLEGAGNYPAIADAGDRLDKTAVASLLRQGRRMMPSFGHLSEDERNEVLDYVMTFTSEQAATDIEGSIEGYTITGYHKFRTPEGLPANNPPWGRLSALNIVSGEIEWQVPLGDYPGLDSLGFTTGTENYGGPVATRGGVVFIAATMDSKIRAFDKRTGEILWEDNLPVPGYATPAVYEIDGRPFVLIACGGGKLGTESGDYYIAYSLPLTQ